MLHNVRFVCDVRCDITRQRRLSDGSMHDLGYAFSSNCKSNKRR